MILDTKAQNSCSVTHHCISIYCEIYFVINDKIQFLLLFKKLGKILSIYANSINSILFQNAYRDRILAIIWNPQLVLYIL
jgi:hypothetical protein